MSALAQEVYDDEPAVAPKSARRWGAPDEELQAVFDAKPMVARCGLCDWTFEGTAGEARAAQFEHRATHARAKTTSNGKVKHLSQGLTADDRREAAEKMGRPKIWTREKILDAFARWAKEHGGNPPTSKDWHTTGGEWPTWASVKAEFGSWSNSVIAAGLEHVPTGGPQRPPVAANADAPAKPAGPTEPAETAPKPPAEPTSEAPTAAVGTLTQLAVAVDAAQVALDEAIVRHADALQALRDALEAA